MKVEEKDGIVIKTMNCYWYINHMQQAIDLNYRHGSQFDTL